MSAETNNEAPESVQSIEAFDPSIAALLNAEREVPRLGSEVFARIHARAVDAAIAAAAANATAATSRGTGTSSPSSSAVHAAAAGATTAVRWLRHPLLTAFVGFGVGIGAGFGASHLLREEVATIENPAPTHAAAEVTRTTEQPVAKTALTKLDPSLPPNAVPAPELAPVLAPTANGGNERPRSIATGASLEEERRLLEAARSALSAGQLAPAEMLLRQHASRFPRSQLREERAASEVELLVKQGRIDAARAAADAFYGQYPSSIYTRRIQRLVPAP